MAKQRNAVAVLLIGALTMLVGGTGMYLGFESGRHPQSGPAVPKQPDHGPILYEMRSIGSEPDRVRLEWKEMSDARGYRITVATAEDESLFASPALISNAWVIPHELRSRLAPQTVYHWKVTVLTDKGADRSSDPAPFVTQ